MSLFTSSAIVGSLTLLSRIFGFVRDMLIAFLLGAGAQTDAFFIAFKLPNFMRRLFAEGAFNSAFLPMFAGMLKTEGKEKSLIFASEVFSFLLMVLLILTVIALLCMPWIMLVLAPGFQDDPEKFDLTVSLTRITFPYLLFISLVCLLSGILNSLHRFAAVAAAPVLLNLSLIGGIVLIAPYTGAAYGLSIGVVIAGLTQLAWLIYFCQQQQMMPHLHWPQLTHRVRKLLVILGPAAIGAGVAQVNLLIDIILASHLDNAVSYLYYADRIYELPLGVIGIAVATALLPMLSKQIRAGEEDAASRSLNHSIMLVWMFGLPATAALLVIAEPVIHVIFEHGEFAETERLQVYPALIAYACGLPAFLLIKVLVASFYAAQDTKTPVKIASISVLVNLICNLILMRYWGHIGLAMATSVAGWLNAILLGYILHRRNRLRPDPFLMRFIAMTVLACLLMMLTLYGLELLLHEWLYGKLIYQIPAMLILVMTGGGVFFMLLFLTGVLSRTQLRGWFKTTSDTA